MKSAKESTSNELEAARARIQNLEDMVSQVQTRNRPINKVSSERASQRNSGISGEAYSIGFSGS
jgi:hypothetical protein